MRKAQNCGSLSLNVRQWLVSSPTPSLPLHLPHNIPKSKFIHSNHYSHAIYCCYSYQFWFYHRLQMDHCIWDDIQHHHFDFEIFAGSHSSLVDKYELQASDPRWKNFPINHPASKLLYYHCAHHKQALTARRSPLLSGSHSTIKSSSSHIHFLFIWK